MEQLIKKYKLWKSKHGNDKDYINDEIHDFIAECSRGELVEAFDWLEESHDDIADYEEQEEDTEFCPHCESAEIICHGNGFDMFWDCENCGEWFSEPNVK